MMHNPASLEFFSVVFFPHKMMFLDISSGIRKAVIRRSNNCITVSVLAVSTLPPMAIRPPLNVDKGCFFSISELDSHALEPFCNSVTGYIELLSDLSGAPFFINIHPCSLLDIKVMFKITWSSILTKSKFVCARLRATRGTLYLSGPRFPHKKVFIAYRANLLNCSNLRLVSTIAFS